MQRCNNTDLNALEQPASASESCTSNLELAGVSCFNSITPGVSVLPACYHQPTLHTHHRHRSYHRHAHPPGPPLLPTPILPSLPSPSPSLLIHFVSVHHPRICSRSSSQRTSFYSVDLVGEPGAWRGRGVWAMGEFWAQFEFTIKL